jgi:hypothetical protein
VFSKCSPMNCAGVKSRPTTSCATFQNGHGATFFCAAGSPQIFTAPKRWPNGSLSPSSKGQRGGLALLESEKLD